MDASFSLPVTPSFTHNVQQDLNGNILFYVVDGTIYDPTGSFVADIECNCYNGELLHSNSEFLIVPVPGNCNQYYLIGAGRTSSSGQGDPKPYYVIYDLSTGDVIGTGGAPGNPAIPLPSYFNNNLHHGIIHFAATPLGANNFRFLFISSTENIFRYKITATGIVLDNGPSDGGVTDFVSDLGFYGNGSASMRSEMEVHSFPNNTFLNSTLLYKIAVPLEGSGGSSTGGIRNFIMIASLDMQGIINSSTVKFIDLISGGGTNYRDVKGLEFSPNGKYLYVNTTLHHTFFM
ncbi:MAG: hypothetical protein IPP71_01870 [Bacteroidetes bacterium]|nr:hypothetical protein [Bacteroidota bacterium]